MGVLLDDDLSSLGLIVEGGGNWSNCRESEEDEEGGGCIAGGEDGADQLG